MSIQPSTSIPNRMSDLNSPQSQERLRNLLRSDPHLLESVQKVFRFYSDGGSTNLCSFSANGAFFSAEQKIIAYILKQISLEDEIKTLLRSAPDLRKNVLEHYRASLKSPQPNPFIPLGEGRNLPAEVMGPILKEIEQEFAPKQPHPAPLQAAAAQMSSSVKTGKAASQTGLKTVQE